MLFVVTSDKAARVDRELVACNNSPKATAHSSRLSTIPAFCPRADFGPPSLRSPPEMLAAGWLRLAPHKTCGARLPRGLSCCRWPRHRRCLPRRGLPRPTPPVVSPVPPAVTGPPVDFLAVVEWAVSPAASAWFFLPPARTLSPAVPGALPAALGRGHDGGGGSGRV